MAPVSTLVMRVLYMALLPLGQYALRSAQFVQAQMMYTTEPIICAGTDNQVARLTPRGERRAARGASSSTMPAVSPEMIGLLGVVVGALLGGGAQLLAGWLQEGRRHQQWLRERRAEIYQEFLSEAGKRLSTLGDYFDLHHQSSHEPPEDYLVVVHQRAEEVGLFGTAEAHERAEGVADALSKLLNGTERESASRYQAAEAALTSFRLHARNDLLKPGRHRVVRAKCSSGAGTGRR